MQIKRVPCGWDFQAVEHVAGTSAAVLAALLDQSLVRRVATADNETGRYDLLELVRRYAAEQIALAERHARYYLNYLVERTPDLHTEKQQFVLTEIQREIENVRAAWRWSAENGQVELISAAADGLFRVYKFRRRFHAGSELFAHAQQCLEYMRATSDVLLGKLQACEGWLTFQSGRQHEGRTLLMYAVELLHTIGAQTELGFALNYLAAATYHTGDYDAAEQFAQ